MARYYRPLNMEKIRKNNPIEYIFWMITFASMVLLAGLGILFLALLLFAFCSIVLSLV